MNQINLVIKGNRAAALAAAAKRDIPIVFDEGNGAFSGSNETLAHTGYEHLDKVKAWYADETHIMDIIPGYGYPVGTLLNFIVID